MPNSKHYNGRGLEIYSAKRTILDDDYNTPITGGVYITNKGAQAGCFIEFPHSNQRLPKKIPKIPLRNLRTAAKRHLTNGDREIMLHYNGNRKNILSHSGDFVNVSYAIVLSRLSESEALRLEHALNTELAEEGPIIRIIS